jgi:hypothetical protein
LLSRILSARGGDRRAVSVLVHSRGPSTGYMDPPRSRKLLQAKLSHSCHSGGSAGQHATDKSVAMELLEITFYVVIGVAGISIAACVREILR